MKNQKKDITFLVPLINSIPTTTGGLKYYLPEQNSF